jgi:hypothetical protein
MLKKELAEQLGISPSMVSRLAKRGMPSDSLERAERWRRRHLEPGRMVGSRFDPSRTERKVQAAALEPDPAAPDVRPTPETHCDIAHLVRVAALLDHHLETGRGELAGALTERLRAVLRVTPNHAAPSLTLRVWRALVNWALLEHPEVHAAPQALALTVLEFAGLACPQLGGAEVLDISRDRFGHSIPGLCPEDDPSD